LEVAFVNRFKVYSDSSYQPVAINIGDYNTVMPWMMHGAMSSDDLRAIYVYLKTVKPVKNKVIRFITK
jgi:hypothetical protein